MKGNPPDGVFAGKERDGAPIFVARAFYGGDLLPGKFIPCIQKAYFPFEGFEISVDEFEVLTGTGSWVASSNGSVPTGAFIAGETSYGESLYVGRAPFSGTLTPGMVHFSHECLYIPFHGGAHEIKTYEVLVDEHVEQWPSPSNAPNSNKLSIHDNRVSSNNREMPVEVAPTTYARGQEMEDRPPRSNTGVNIENSPISISISFFPNFFGR